MLPPVHRPFTLVRRSDAGLRQVGSREPGSRAFCCRRLSRVV